MINLDELQRILDMVTAHDLRELKLEVEDFKLRVRRQGPEPPAAVEAGPARPAGGPSVVAFPAPVAPAASQVPTAVSAQAPGAAEPSAPPADAGEQVIVTSPIVGTFYRAPEPGARAFVDIGQKVQKGQVLCIIEAMKLMNEIESEAAGEIVAVFVENGQPVQFGERLFAIKIR